MNVLLVAATPPQERPLLGGSHRYLTQLASLAAELADQDGGTVTLLSDEGPNYEPLWEAIDGAGVRREAAPFCSDPAAAAARLDELLAAAPVDLVHVNGHQGWLAGGLLASRELPRARRRAFTMHLPLRCLEADLPPLLRRTPWGWYSRTRRQERAFASLFTDIFSVSQVYAERAVARGVASAGAIHHVPNAVDCDRLGPAASTDRPDGGPVIGMLGELRIHKRVDRAIRALAALGGSCPTARLVLAGEGALEGELRALAAELGVDDRVEFLGYVSDLPGFFRSIDVLAMPSDFEAAPFSILEAMACGVPLAVTDCGDMGLMVRDGVDGLVTRAGDQPAFEAALTRLCLEPDLRERMASAARERAVERFSRPAWRAAMTAHYGRMIGS